MECRSGGSKVGGLDFRSGTERETPPEMRLEEVVPGEGQCFFWIFSNLGLGASVDKSSSGLAQKREPLFCANEKPRATMTS